MQRSLFLAILSLAYAMPPVQVPFSSNPLGFDGPWNVVTVGVGTPPQSVDLFPGSIYWTPVLSNKFCDNRNFSNSGDSCYAKRGGFFNPADSSTATYQSTTLTFPLWTNRLSMNGRSQDFQDSISFGETIVPSVDILLTDWAYFDYYGSRHIPAAMGQLSLGSTDPAVGPDDSAPLPNALYKRDDISSASFGLHIGSAAPDISGGIPGSLWFGGYDQNRVIGPVLSTGITESSSFPLRLQTLGFTSLSKQTKLQNQTNILQGQASGNFLNILIQPTQPYFILPKSVCDAMTAELPIKYDSSSAFYLWDTNDPAYTDLLINGPNYFTFTLNNELDSIDIKMPLTLLHLNLDPPLVKSTTPYFPCYPKTAVMDGTWVLGQAFLQTAFFSSNWLPSDGGTAQFYIAQAPGPTLNTTADPVTISADVSSYPFSTVSNDSHSLWAESWYPFFNKHGADLTMPTTNHAGSDNGQSGGGNSHSGGSKGQSGGSNGLSGGAIAGIVIGVVAGVALIALLVAALLIRRRRQRPRQLEHEKLGSTSAELDGRDVLEKPANELNPELNGRHPPDGELPYYHTKYQLPTADNEQSPAELSARGENVMEPNSRRGSPWPDSY